MPNTIAPLTCAQCGSNEVIEVIEDLTLHHIFAWNARRGRYQLEHVKDKSIGDTYLICSEGHRYTEVQEEAFQGLVMTEKAG